MNSPYALIPVVSLILLMYLFSHLLSVWKIIRRESHIYFWNLVLLITFTVSGLLGLLAVVKINYSLTIPHYEQILRLHIHVGIGMVMVAFIHLARHFRYYLPSRKSGKPPKSKPEDSVVPPGNDFEKPGILLFLLGFVSFTAQLVLVREFISVFTGNELVIGFFLSLWLILTGLGAMAARNTAPSSFSGPKLVILIEVLSILPLLILFLLYWFKSILFPPGTAPGPVEILAGTALLLFPVCFLSGYLFILLTGVQSSQSKSHPISGSYFIETAGSLLGGIFFSFLFVFFLRSLEILTLVSAGSILLLQFRVFQRKFSWKSTGVLLLLIITTALVFVLNLDTKLKSFFFRNQKIILNQTDYTGNQVVTNQEGQLNFFTNNNLDFYTGNVIDSEESAHYAMVQAVNPQKVLIVSGDVISIAREVQKYNVKNIDLISFSSQYYKLYEKFNPAETPDNVLREFTGDPIRFLQRNKTGVYDVVLLNVPPPLTLKDNRFYTKEFLKLMKEHCAPGAVVSLQLPSTANYAGPEALNLNSIVYNTLRSVFREVMFISGEKNHYLASDHPLRSDIARLIADKKTENKYVNADYIDDALLKERSSALVGSLVPSAPTNSMVNPVACLSQLQEWLRMHGAIYRIFVIVPVLLLIWILVMQSPVRAGLVVSGFSASSLQILLIMGFQIFFGNIFYQVTLFFILFLAGLALGTRLGERGTKTIRVFNAWQLCFTGLSVLGILLFMFMLKYPFARNLPFLFHLANGVASFCLGYLFTLAASLETQDVTGKVSGNYSADLMGSAIGTYLTTVFMVPALGINGSFLLIGSASLISFSYLFMRRKRYN